MFHNQMQDALNVLRALEGSELDTLLRKEALCNLLLANVGRARQPDLWAELEFRLGSALLQLGVYRSDVSLLEASVDAYRAALLEYTRERLPHNWAITQNSLGIALQTLGERGDTHLLEAAAQAYRAALLEQTRNRNAPNWARIQTNLGDTLREIGKRRGDVELLKGATEAYRAASLEYACKCMQSEWVTNQNSLGIVQHMIGYQHGSLALLESAVETYRDTLLACSREHAPIEWAGVQNNLACALMTLGEFRGDMHLLDLATQACRATLLEVTRDRAPLDWATAQNNLGNVLQVLGTRRGDALLLDMSIEAYRAALLERTRKRVPLDWATTQTSLGTALRTLGAHRGSTQLLEASVEAHRAALLECTRERSPLDWAATQDDLGNVLATLGERRSDASLLEMAAEAYRTALTERTRQRAPLAWAKTKNNLGTVLARLYECSGNVELLETSAETFRATLIERTRDRTPLDWATTQNNLGTTLQMLGEHYRDAGLLETAVRAYGSALLERTRERVPLDWATTQDNLGNALRKLWEFQGDVRLLEAAIEAHRAVLLEHTRKRMPVEWAMAQTNLGNALQALGRCTCNPSLLKAAMDAYKSALMEIHHDTMPVHWATVQSNLGSALETLGRNCSDTKLLEASVEAYRVSLTERTQERDPLQRLYTVRALGRVLLHLERWAEVKMVLTGALEEALAVVYTASSTTEQYRSLKALAGLGDLLAFACLHLGQPSEALIAAGCGRAVLLAATQAGDRLAGDSTRSLRFARNEWRAACRRSSITVKSLLATEAVCAVYLEEAAARRREAVESMRVSYERYRSLLHEAGFDHIEFLSIADLAAALPPAGALATLILADASASVLLLRHCPEKAILVQPQVEVLQLPGLTDAAIAALLLRTPSGVAGPTPWFAGYSGYLRALEQDDGAATISANETWNGVVEDVMTVLWDKLMRPLNDRLRGMGLAPGDEVVLCLPGCLATLPLHAAGERVQADEGSGRTVWRCFLDDFAVSYVPSPQALLDARSRADQPARQGTSLLAVTNPTADPRIGIPVNPAWVAFLADRRKELRHAEASVEAVSAEIGPDGPSWTHLSLYCHGSFDPAEPDNTGLEMAGGALLTVRHLRSLELPTARLAFLGACESGMIGFDLADEQIGLPASLLEAGIPAVAASHWPVSANATRLLAEAFFGLMLQHRLRPAQALRLAQLGLRDAALMAAQGREATVVQAAEALLRVCKTSNDNHESRTTTTYTSHPTPARPARPHDLTLDLRHADPISWAAFSLTGT